MYDYGAIATRVNVVNADRKTPGFMRSPPEVLYVYALQCGMDELAYALKRVRDLPIRLEKLLST